jgi:hypothetical protein
MWMCTPRSTAQSAITWASRRLAVTPPAKYTWPTGCSSTARSTFCTNACTTAVCSARAAAARSSGWRRTISANAVFNPEITKVSKETDVLEEGCLSIPGIYDEVKRPDRVVIQGYDKNGKKLKIKAWGLLARVFQHEVDHLDGKFFLDRVKK